MRVLAPGSKFPLKQPFSAPGVLQDGRPAAKTAQDSNQHLTQPYIATYPPSQTTHNYFQLIIVTAILQAHTNINIQKQIRPHQINTHTLFCIITITIGTIF